jgi:hypothetical protein
VSPSLDLTFVHGQRKGSAHGFDKLPLLPLFPSADVDFLNNLKCLEQSVRFSFGRDVHLLVTAGHAMRLESLWLHTSAKFQDV